MSVEAECYPFLARKTESGPSSLLPLMPISLSHGQTSVSTLAMLDTGATVNVIPYRLGLQLGASWEKQTIAIPLSGNLANQEAKALVLTGTIGKFPPVALAFAWSKSDDAPMLLGQMNFFMEFDVCFFRSKAIFEVKPR